MFWSYFNLCPILNICDENIQENIAPPNGCPLETPLK